MKFTTTITLLLSATALYTAADAAMGDKLRQPHKAHTMHMMMCIPELDMVACDRIEGKDAADVMYDGSTRMVWWDEYHANMDSDEHATATWSPKKPNEIKMQDSIVPLKGISNGDTSDKNWKPVGEWVEEGVIYQRYVLNYDDVVLGNSEADKQRQLVEAGLVPDRWEYLETQDGDPYVVRAYSGRNENAMYSQTMFMMLEALTEEEMKQDCADLAMDVATTAMRETGRLLRGVKEQPKGGLRGSKVLRRKAIDAAVTAEFAQFEFPSGCLDNDDARKCFNVLRAISLVSGEDGETELHSNIRFDTVLRDGDGRSAELFGEVIAHAETNDLIEVAAGARGCVKPGELKIRNLVGVSVTKCLFGQISRDEEGSVSGSLGVGVQLKAEISKVEASLDIEGELEVRVTDDKKFAGIAGRVSVTASAEVLALGVTGEVTAEPTDPQEGSGWVTTVYVTPSIEWNLFLFSGSAEHQFRIFQAGPGPLVETTEPRGPRSPLPNPPSSFRPDDKWSTISRLRDSSTLAYSDHFDNRQEAQTPVRQIVVTRVFYPRDDRFGRINGVHTLSDKPQGFRKNQGKTSNTDTGSSYFTNVDYTLTLRENEWIVRVSGTASFTILSSIAFDTNLGRQLRVEGRIGRKDQFFEMVARDNEALYGFDAYVGTNGLNGLALRPQWHTAPTLPCEASTCLSREADPITGQDPLQCTDWPVDIGYSSEEERCLLGNTQLNDGYEYIYNSGRGTAEAECGADANCWCCRRKSREAQIARQKPLQCTNWPVNTGYSSNEERCLLGNTQLNDGYEYVYNSGRGTAEAKCGADANCWCRRRERK